MSRENELPFTLVLIIACLLAYGSTLLPMLSDWFDWGSCILGVGLFVVLLVSDVRENRHV